MNHRIRAIGEGIRAFACCCSPRKKKYRVGHFNEEHEWVLEDVMAYSSFHAADMLGLRAGYNCTVGRIIEKQ